MCKPSCKRYSDVLQSSLHWGIKISSHTAGKVGKHTTLHVPQWDRLMKKNSLIWCVCSNNLWLRSSLWLAFCFLLSSIQSSRRLRWRCTLLPASSIIYCLRQRAWQNTTTLGSKPCLFICQTTWQDGEQRRHDVGWVLTSCFCSSHRLSCSLPLLWYMEGGLRPGSGSGLKLRLRLALIKFSRHHWQACCSSCRAINLVLPITALLLPQCPSPPHPLCHPSHPEGGGRRVTRFRRKEGPRRRHEGRTGSVSGFIWCVLSPTSITMREMTLSYSFVFATL